MHFILLLDTELTVKCTGQLRYGRTPKDKLQYLLQKGSLVNDIFSRAIEQVNQKV